MKGAIITFTETMAHSATIMKVKIIDFEVIVAVANTILLIVTIEIASLKLILVKVLI